MRTNESERQQIAKNISNLIKLSGKSQKQIADELGIAEQTISNHKNLRNLPDITQVRAFCKVLDCNYEDIFGRVE